MEIQFQQQKTPSKIRVRNNKFIGVRQRASGRWVAEIKDTTQKIRMWLGTFQTAEEAARAYDEAACLLRGPNTRTNFVTQVSPNSLLASRINNLLNNKKKKSTKGKKQESTSEFDCSQKKIDEVYKPDLTNCAGDAWGFDEELFLFEFERIRVERQISASLYAINDYMDTLYDPTQPLWDLPPLSSLLT